MKKIKSIIILAVLIMSLFNSCKEFDSDFLETPAKSTLQESLIFSQVDLARGAIDGILEPIGQTNSYRGRHIPFYGFNTDTEWNYNSSSVGNATGDLMVYDAKANNTQMNRTNSSWAMIYRAIERANICIKGIRLYGNPEVGNEMGQLLGEALTLRAMYYSDLVKTWGDVPALFEPTTFESAYTPKSSRNIVYKQIIADLAEASELVAWPNESSATTSVEKVNKAFVKGLRARVALAASGFQQFPNDGVRRSNDPDLSVAKMYKIALDECRSIINSGTVGLEPSFETVWRKLNEENISAGGESIWEMPFSDGRGRVNFSFAIRHRSVDQHTGQARGGISGPLPTVFYDYDEADSRRDITCVPYQWGTAIDGFSKQELVSLDIWYFGKYRYEWMNRYVTSSNDDGINKMYMRYAEIILMAAEAANELEGPSAAAPYLKQIRRRAFNAADHATKVDGYVNALTTKEDMFNAIVKEHKYEFTGEMERKQALIRWNKLGTNLATAKQKMLDLKNRTGEYADVPTTLYYKYEADEETLKIYGLNRGETTNPGPDYFSKDWTVIEDDVINSLFKEGVNPDDRQFWPIWQVFIDSSNGTLVNDYGY
ncbi:RagB/SusD family nutrient uptake outer membrane protein [Polaribacter reichenbachii]|uniref:Carbohydrate-binding protein SusD n=1 Tax=Polaribacter reichenbachii TaxID=996801 RepID=A0A1B8TVE5_9FLAO|nr:RagB/SusD family nutrient uptake outer membrane protein [Polaribacter reichenbachii]APZ45416.1 RagB/SusD family nutrient uptake outer membrane protein [Polaribacter reichenbachii]AUC19277.1 RagB/SusD family nutrient uptake outer membrane protein [Polaribacter reichenbachii]OBY63568.1 carbohydrate-binding protein SusD [Polaribacter reichenbachii]